MRRSTRQKLFYALVIPIFIGVAGYLLQHYYARVDPFRPVLEVGASDGGVKTVKNLSGEDLRVHVRFIFRKPDGTEEHCFSPDYRDDSLPRIGIFPTVSLKNGETAQFPLAPDLPEHKNAVLVDTVVRAWNAENETVFYDGPGDPP